MLAAEALVDLRPHGITSVSKLHTREVNHIVAAMKGLETLAGELRCELCCDGQPAEIRSRRGRMTAHYRKHNKAGCSKLNQEIRERFMRTPQH